MATLRDIRRRISSVRSTQQITKAMKMVSAAKLRRAQERLLSARPYAMRIQTLLAHVAAQVDRSKHPLLVEREIKNVLYLVVSADRGLCGSFNANILRRAKSEVDAHQQNGGVGFKLVTVGRKSFEHFSRRSYSISEKYVNIYDHLEFGNAVEISNRIQQLYREQEVDRVIAVYNEFKSAAIQKVTLQQLLPILPEFPVMQKYQPVEYLYEPSIEEILNEICPKFLNVQVWRMLLESYASEQGARMVAMESASESAEEMIHELTLYYNKVRQASITKEIAEIVGGANALRG
jgi:F-type H+-transporting ATPase subunit gamma